MPWLNIAAAAIGGLLSYKSAQEQRKQAIADQDKQFVRMRNAAQRAGFNPLTVMRLTGGQGFTGLPTISKAAAFGNAAAGIFDAVRQSPIDKYNKEIRKLELEQRQTTLSIDKLQLDELAKPKKNKQIAATSVPLIDPFTGKQIKNASGPVFVDAVAQEAIPKYRTVYDQATGKTFAILNPEITEMGGPLEIMVSQGILASAEASAETGRGMEFRIPGFNTSVGWPQDPLNYNKGFRFPKGDNTQYAKPELLF